MSKSTLLKNTADFVSERNSNITPKIDDYISTENLLPNKAGITKATNMPIYVGSLPTYKPEDILISNIRPYLKKIWFSNKYGTCSSDVLILRAKPEISPEFLYYSLFRDDFFNHIMKGVKGTKMPRGDKAQMLEFAVPTFDLKTQQKIAAVLTALDAKIDCNNRINAELETMARALYDYWFVQFDFPDTNGNPYKTAGGKMTYNPTLKREIPAGWQDVPLSDWIAADKTGDWGKDTAQGNYTLQVNCIRGADINSLNGAGTIEAPARFILEKNKTKLLAPFDFVVEISGGSPTQSTGRLAPITIETFNRFANPPICSNFCKVISLKENAYFFNFAYLWKSAYDNQILFGWEGKTSGIKNLLFDSFVEKHFVSKPPKNLAQKFFDFLNPLENKKQKLMQENHHLAQLRDWLLPLLMNGQVTPT